MSGRAWLFPGTFTDGMEGRPSIRIEYGRPSATGRTAGLAPSTPFAAASNLITTTVGTYFTLFLSLPFVLPRSGVLMNNGVMWFDPSPGQPNSVGPGKRPLTNMCPVVIRDGNRPVLAGGASGGWRIMAAVFQTLSYAADFGMTPTDAVHHPRIDVSDADNVTADDRLGGEVVEALRAGGDVELVEHAVMPLNFACPT